MTTQHHKNVWTTFDGRKIFIDRLEDQHLSNIYWFYLLFWGEKNISPKIITELMKRFGSLDNILYFKPLPIPSEIADLRKKGHIAGQKIVMIQNGKQVVIGSISHIPVSQQY